MSGGNARRTLLQLQAQGFARTQTVIRTRLFPPRELPARIGGRAQGDGPRVGLSVQATQTHGSDPVPKPPANLSNNPSSNRPALLSAAV